MAKRQSISSPRTTVNLLIWLFAGLLSSCGAIASFYYSLYSLWLNAHPLYDDAYWGKQFWIFMAAGIVLLAIALASIARILRRKREEPGN